MQVRPTHEDISTLRHNGGVVAARADTLGRLAILKMTENGPWEESVTLGPNTNLTIFILAKSPDKSFLVDDLLRNHSDVISLFVLRNRALALAVGVGPITTVRSMRYAARRIVGIWIASDRATKAGVRGVSVHHLMIVSIVLVIHLAWVRVRKTNVLHVTRGPHNPSALRRKVCCRLVSMMVR